MTNNASAVPVLTEASIESLTDKQIIEWYRYHSSATVRALVRRMALMMEREHGKLCNAYQDGFYAGFDHANPHNLSPAELRLAVAYTGE